MKEERVPPESALGSGYTQSKWVIENILLAAQEYTDLCPVSVRVGQITGGPSGAWNTTEWFPALLKSSQYLGCLPSLDKVRGNVRIGYVFFVLTGLKGMLVDSRIRNGRSSYPYAQLSVPHPAPHASSSCVMGEPYRPHLLSPQTPPSPVLRVDAKTASFSGEQLYWRPRR